MLFIGISTLKTFKKLFSDPEFQGLLIFVVIILLTGTLFYSYIEGWNFLDALYFSTTTLTTVGLGDIHPVTTAGKIFTIAYILIGIGIIFGFINTIAHHAKKENPITKMFSKPEEKKH